MKAETVSSGFKYGERKIRHKYYQFVLCTYLEEKKKVKIKK